MSVVVMITCIGLAGALGAVARYGLGRFVAERIASSIPWGTILINVSGAFVIGLLFALASHKVISSDIQLVLATGFLGGYTTYSTMCWEGVQLGRGGRTMMGIVYLGGSLLLGLGAAALGLLAGGVL